MRSSIKTEFTEFFRNPKNFLSRLVILWLHPYKFPSKDILRVYPYDPESEIRARELMKKIMTLCPKLDIHLIGSIGLQIEGRGDIDLYAVTPFSEFVKTTQKIASVFGKPIKTGKTFGEWKFEFKGYPAELHVADPKDKDYYDQILLFNLLKNNHEYLNEYRNLKNKLNNRPMREYASKRMVLFNKVLLAANHRK